MSTKKIPRSISIEKEIWDAGVTEAAKRHKTMTQFIREYLLKFIPKDEELKAG